MTKIAYTVSCTIADETKAADWLAWLRGGHIRDVMNNGAESAQIVAFADNRFEVRYLFPDRSAYDAYYRDHAPRLRAEGLEKFPPADGFSYSRTEGEVVLQEDSVVSG